MRLQIAGIEWDEGNRAKCEKHGLTVEDIEEFFSCGEYKILADEKHSEIEERFIAVGLLKEQRFFVAFTLRKKENSLFIRPISARQMREKEVRKLW